MCPLSISSWRPCAGEFWYLSYPKFQVIFGSLKSYTSKGQRVIFQASHVQDCHGITMSPVQTTMIYASWIFCKPNLPNGAVWEEKTAPGSNRPICCDATLTVENKALELENATLEKDKHLQTSNRPFFFLIPAVRFFRVLKKVWDDFCQHYMKLGGPLQLCRCKESVMAFGAGRSVSTAVHQHLFFGRIRVFYWCQNYAKLHLPSSGYCDIISSRPKSDKKPPVLKFNSSLEVKNQMFGKPKTQVLHSFLEPARNSLFHWKQLEASTKCRCSVGEKVRCWSVKNLVGGKATLRYSNLPRNHKIRRSQRLVP